MKKKIIIEFNNDGKITYFYRSRYEYEYWIDYDENGAHYKDSYGFEWYEEYDENGNVIYYKDSKGVERWYDEKGNEICEKFNGYEYWYEEVI